MNTIALMFLSAAAAVILFHFQVAWDVAIVSVGLASGLVSLVFGSGR